jgi:hypothetical protein
MAVFYFKIPLFPDVAGAVYRMDRFGEFEWMVISSEFIGFRD